MVIGTDKELFSEKKKRIKRTGRPRLNREIGYRMIAADYTTRQICRALRCSPRSVKMLRAEWKALNGEKGE